MTVDKIKHAVSEATELIKATYQDSPALFSLFIIVVALLIGTYIDSKHTTEKIQEFVMAQLSHNWQYIDKQQDLLHECYKQNRKK